MTITNYEEGEVQHLNFHSDIVQLKDIIDSSFYPFKNRLQRQNKNLSYTYYYNDTGKPI